MASDLISGIIGDCCESAVSVERSDIAFSLAIFLSTFSNAVSSVWATLVGLKRGSFILGTSLVLVDDVAAAGVSLRDKVSF